MSVGTQVERLRDIVGQDNVTDKLFMCIPYSRDQAILARGRTPDVVVRPGSAQDIQSILREVNRTRTPVYIRGAYTSPFGYYPKEGGIVLDTTRLNRILEIDDDTLTCTVEPGLTWGELEAALYQRGYTFLVAPEGSLGGTVGGHVSNRGSSPTSFLVANQADCVTGLQVVLPTGELMTTGIKANPATAHPFMRYAWMSDLTGLFLGAEGTLGVITEVGLKIEELPEAVGNVAYAFDDIYEAAKALYESRRKRIPASAVLLHDGRTMDAVEPHNAPHDNFTISWARIGGPKAVVDNALETLDRVCTAHGGRSLGPGIPSRYWSERYRAVAGFFYVLGARMTYHWLVPLGDFARYYLKAREMAEYYRNTVGVKMTIAGHPCDRAFLLVMSAHCHEQDQEEWEKARSVFQEMRAPLLDMGAGFYRVGIEYSADQMYRTGPYYDLLKRIKQLLDPNRIMNPGFGGL